MNIPKHLKILSILVFAYAALAAIIGFVIFPPFADRGPLSAGAPGTVSPVLQLGLSILPSVLAILFLVFLGINLRKLKPWARILTLVFSLGSIFFGLVSLITGEPNFSIGFLIQVYAIWVLFRPDVKEAFGVKNKISV